MKKNNKGFFLAEAIIMIGIIAVVMATVYKNVGDLYKNFKYRTKYWDQPEDIYTLKEYEKLLKSSYYTIGDNKIPNTICPNDSTVPCTIFNMIVTDSDDEKLGEKKYNGFLNIIWTNTSMRYTTALESNNDPYDSTRKILHNNLMALYIYDYVTDVRPKVSTGIFKEPFNLYLKRMKITTNDSDAYRLIGVFRYGTDDYRFASIKVDNPKFD